MAYDWLSASIAARRELYRTCKQVVHGHYVGHWQNFYEAVFDGAGQFGTGHEDNFRSGRIGRTKAATLVRWLTERHPALAAELDQRLQIEKSQAAQEWESFLGAHGRDATLEVVKIDGLGIVGFARAQSRAIATIRRNEEFCLRLTSRMNGFGIAFQRAGGLWFRLPLSDHDHAARIVAGLQFLPRDARGEIIPFSEETDTGAIEFVILIGAEKSIRSAGAMVTDEGPVPSGQLAIIAKTFEPTSLLEVHRTRALII